MGNPNYLLMSILSFIIAFIGIVVIIMFVYYRLTTKKAKSLKYSVILDKISNSVISSHSVEALIESIDRWLSLFDKNKGKPDTELTVITKEKLFKIADLLEFLEKRDCSIYKVQPIAGSNNYYSNEAKFNQQYLIGYNDNVVLLTAKFPAKQFGQSVQELNENNPTLDIKDLNEMCVSCTLIADKDTQFKTDLIMTAIEDMAIMMPLQRKIGTHKTLHCVEVGKTKNLAGNDQFVFDTQTKGFMAVDESDFNLSYSSTVTNANGRVFKFSCTSLIEKAWPTVFKSFASTLITGLTGTGKTALLDIIADKTVRDLATVNMNVFYISPNCYDNITAAIQAIIRRTSHSEYTSLIIIDQAEKILTEKYEDRANLLKMMDSGFRRMNQIVFLFATTTPLEAIPDDMKREGRLDFIINTDLLTPEGAREKAESLKLSLKEDVEYFDINQLNKYIKENPKGVSLAQVYNCLRTKEFAEMLASFAKEEVKPQADGKAPKAPVLPAPVNKKK